jgi:hypothetical protein
LAEIDMKLTSRNGFALYLQGQKKLKKISGDFSPRIKKATPSTAWAWPPAWRRGNERTNRAK